MPEKIALFPERELNRDLYLWLVALSAANVDDNLPWIERNQAATQVTLTHFPGLASKYDRLVNALLPLRPLPENLPIAEAAQETVIRQALLKPDSIQTLPPSKTVSSSAIMDAPKSS